VVELLGHSWQFSNLDLSHPTHPTDITNYDQVKAALSNSAADTVLHCAAYTDVGKSWEQRDDLQGIAYQVNVIGTQNIAKAAAATGKHLIHISTAYVFNGGKEASYTEEDQLSPIEWYGQTKALAEAAVDQYAKSWTIFRIDQPFRSDPFARLDFAHKILDRLTAGSLPPQFTNHWIGPTFIEDFVRIIGWAIATHPQGIFHASSGERWTDFEFATALKETLHLPGEIQPGNLNDYLRQSTRPYQKNTSLATTKLRQLLPFTQLPIRQALQLVHFGLPATE